MPADGSSTTSDASTVHDASSPAPDSAIVDDGGSDAIDSAERCHWSGSVPYLHVPTNPVIPGTSAHVSMHLPAIQGVPGLTCEILVWREDPSGNLEADGWPPYVTGPLASGVHTLHAGIRTVELADEWEMAPGVEVISATLTADHRCHWTGTTPYLQLPGAPVPTGSQVWITKSDAAILEPLPQPGQPEQDCEVFVWREDPDGVVHADGAAAYRTPSLSNGEHRLSAGIRTLGVGDAWEMTPDPEIVTVMTPGPPPAGVCTPSNCSDVYFCNYVTYQCELPQCRDGSNNTEFITGEPPYPPSDIDDVTDYPADPGCDGPDDHYEHFICAGASCPACANDLDDDGNGLIDWPDDPDCVAASDNSE